MAWGASFVVKPQLQGKIEPILNSALEKSFCLALILISSNI